MKKVLIHVIVLVLLSFLGYCIIKNVFFQNISDINKNYTIVGATNNPQTSGHYKGLLYFKKLVEERTDDYVNVILYSDGALGDEEQLVEGMINEEVDVLVAASSKYANFVPEMDIYSIPYTFKNWQHFKSMMDSKVDKKIRKIVRQRMGDEYIGLFTDGVRNIFAYEELKSFSDLNGLKIRTMTGPEEINTWIALGTKPVPLPYPELYSALENGVVDAAENSMTSILGMNFYESCKYILRTQHNYSALPLIISGKVLKKLPERYSQIVLQAAKDTCKMQVEIAIEHDENNEIILINEKNVIINELPADDYIRMQEITRKIQDENAKRIKMEEELDHIRKLGEKY